MQTRLNILRTSPASLLSAVRDFRAGSREFFTVGKPGPKTAPGKDAARPRILQLRAAGHSIDEMAAALAAEGTPLNRTGIAEVIADEGLPRLWRRPDAARGGVQREIQARAESLDFTALPDRAETRLAGLLLVIPDLIDLGIADMVAAAGYPSTPKIPALSYVLSLLALKLTATRRVSHVYDIAADPGAALFAGLTALPKATALTTYSYRLEHSRQAAFLTALDKASLAAGLADGEALNLDFHAVMHWGDDPILEKHYVPRRSQRTRSVLTFFAEDAGTRTLLYANADLSKASQNREVIAFADHWKAVTGHDPALLIFDSKLTTQAVLAELDDREIGFITLRARHPGVTTALAALPASAWKSMILGRAGGRTRRVKVHDDPAATLSAYPRPIRQLAVTGLGHDQPTLIITNDSAAPARKIDPVLRPADEHRAAPRRGHPVFQPRRPRRRGPAQHRPRRRSLRPGPHPLHRAAPPPARLPRGHPRHPPAPVPVHRRDHHHPPRPDHRPDQPAHLLTRTPPGQPPRNDHRPLVGRPDPPLRVRLTRTWGPIRLVKIGREDRRQAIRFTANARFKVLTSGKLRLPKIGDVPVRWSRPLPSEPSRVTVIKERRQGRRAGDDGLRSAGKTGSSPGAAQRSTSRRRGSQRGSVIHCQPCTSSRTGRTRKVPDASDSWAMIRISWR